MQVDQYFKITGRPVKLRVDLLMYGSTHILAGRPYHTCGPINYEWTPIIKGEPVVLKYRSTRIGAFDPLGTLYNNVFKPNLNNLVPYNQYHQKRFYRNEMQSKIINFGKKYIVQK